MNHDLTTHYDKQQNLTLLGLPVEVIDLCLAYRLKQMIDDCYQAIDQQPSASAIEAALGKLIDEINKLRSVCKQFDGLIKIKNIETPTLTYKGIKQRVMPLSFAIKPMSKLDDLNKDKNNQRASNVFEEAISILFEDEAGVTKEIKYFAQNFRGEPKQEIIEQVNRTFQGYTFSDIDQVIGTFRIKSLTNSAGIVLELFLDLMSLEPVDQLNLINCILSKGNHGIVESSTIYKKFIFIIVVGEVLSKYLRKDQQYWPQTYTDMKAFMQETAPPLIDLIKIQCVDRKKELENQHLSGEPEDELEVHEKPYDTEFQPLHERIEESNEYQSLLRGRRFSKRCLYGSVAIFIVGVACLAVFLITALQIKNPKFQDIAPILLLLVSPVVVGIPLTIFVVCTLMSCVSYNQAERTMLINNYDTFTRDTFLLANNNQDNPERDAPVKVIESNLTQ